MLEGGELVIGAKSVGEFAEITLRDTGPGMSAEGLEKIFEPLYTTKIQGTGLGLLLVRSFMPLHEGEMSIDSALKQGTTINLYFSSHPLIERNAA